MNAKQYFQVRERFRLDYEANLRGLDATWVALNHTPPPKAPPAKKAGQDNGSVASAVREALPEVGDDFTTIELLEVLRKTKREIPQSTLVHTLKRMSLADRPLVAIVEGGKGKRPTKYKKTMVQSLSEI